MIRVAVTKYFKTHPEVNKAVVARYTETHPEVIRTTKSQYGQMSLNQQTERRVLTWKVKADSRMMHNHDQIYEADITLTL